MDFLDNAVKNANFIDLKVKRMSSSEYNGINMQYIGKQKMLFNSKGLEL